VLTSVPDRFGPYRLTQSLGEGGMGIVYEAIDERLDRRIALKVIRRDFIEAPAARDRFRREARLAASVNHPRICQIYDIGDEGGVLFVAMERLEGEPLSAKISRGPIPVAETADVGLGILEALDALHRRAIVHRDLKPSNVFLTPHGVKLLDFGLARSVAQDAETQAPMTMFGTLVGTPRYMAPEQVRAEPIDERIDLFATGAILYEMLTGTAPFEAPALHAIIERVMHFDPPMLGGSPAIAAADRVIHRSLAKAPDRRYTTAAAMADDLRGVLSCRDVGEPRRATSIKRLIVLPFRLLKADPDTEFLSFGLADAITSSLASIETLVVRSSLAAGRFASEVPDLKAIAAEADVDVVVSGTLLRAGDQLRVSVQLIEAPGGRLIWADTPQAHIADIFQLQDDLSRRIVESLERPLSGREGRPLGRDAPSNALAYEFYLRANALSRAPATADLAHDMYQDAVDADPKFAPAWAGLGRVCRVIGKFRNEPEMTARAEAALNRALALNPDLSAADRTYAQLEVDYGRSKDALVRLARLASVRSNDPELFAGLVHSCRYCGLFKGSVNAHERARRLDPKIRTSLQYTLLMAGDYTEAIGEAGGHDSVAGMALAMAGDPQATETCRRQAADLRSANMQPVAAFCDGIASLMEGDVAPLRAAIDAWIAGGLRDPEALFIHGLFLAGGGEYERALQLLNDAVDRGYAPHETLARHRWLDPLRARPDFQELVQKTLIRHHEAVAAFTEAGGTSL